MVAYELMLAANNNMIQGSPIPETVKCDIAGRLLSLANPTGEVTAFHKGMGVSGSNRNMYPAFYIPPYNGGKKYRLITGELPKTHLLSSNHYELEILRLLALWKGDDAAVKYMVGKTLERLESTCFGRFCGTGECVGAGVTALRFMSAVLPRGDSRIERLYEPLHDLYMQTGGRGHGNLPLRYFRLAMAGMGRSETYEAV